MLTDEKICKLTETANAVRQDIITMLLVAGSGHTAGPLGMADVFTYLYFHALSHKSDDPLWEDRDRVVLSNGHICPVQYATMARAGYFPLEELRTLRKFGSRLQGHPHREYLPGIEVSSGPLGSGLGQAVGIALGLRMRGKRSYTYALMGDGELDCGIIWEAAMLAGREKLGNLIGIVDRNGIQIDGYTWDVMPLEPLKDKWESFGWHVIEISGHDFQAIDSAVEEAKSVQEKPADIIAHTVPGKGVAEFERDYHWHGKPPNAEEGKRALKELRTLKNTIECHHLC